MAEATDGKWGYNAGPSDVMKQEIGQIVVNHALCDPALYALFHALSGIDTQAAKLLTRTLKLKALTIADLIMAFRKENEESLYPPLIARIDECIDAYRKLSKNRNVVAHWQWMPSPEGQEIADTSNLLGMNQGAPSSHQSFTLEMLKEISLGLIEVQAMMYTLAVIIPAEMPDFVCDKALEQFDCICKKVRAALMEIPDFSVEEQP